MPIRYDALATLMATTALLFVPAEAISATYSESVNGELPAAAPPLNVSAVVNEVVDTVTGELLKDAGDLFYFEKLPAGVQTFRLAYEADLLGIALRAVENATDANVSPTIYLPGLDGTDAVEFMTTAGFNGTLGVLIESQEGGTALSWTLSLVEGTTVPLPAGALLLGTGLAALGAAGARGRARRRS